MRSSAARSRIGDILIDIDPNAPANVVGLEACKNAVVHEMFYRLVRLGRAKDVRKFSKADVFTGSMSFQSNVFIVGKSHFRAQTPDKVEKKGKIKYD